MAAKIIEISGKRFGKLVALEFSHKVGRAHYWNFQCDCGKTNVINKTSVTQGLTNSCGCLSKKHFINLVGQSFNQNVAIELLGQNKQKCWMYKFQCKCGTVFTSEGNDVKSGKIQSCGCRWNCKQTRNKKSLTDSGYSGILASYKSAAKKRGYDFSLTKPEFLEMIKSNCHYCGTPPSRIRKWQNGSFIYNGIDRLDNNIGYTTSNTVTACYECNQAKHQMTEEHFKKWLKRCFDFMQTKKGIWSTDVI